MKATRHLVTSAALLLAIVGARLSLPGPRVNAEQLTEAAVALARPDWHVHDSWVIETLTQRSQIRETTPARASARIRWEFTVGGIDKVAGRDCYRIEIQCLAEGGLKPATKIWCDQETLFIRQFQTSMPGAGRQWLIQESYETPADQLAPVLAPLTAIPLGLPAFVQKEAKSSGEFTYTSQALPAESKDLNLLRFAHTTKQTVRQPGAKSLQQVPAVFAKDLEQKPVREVELTDQQQTIIQLWQQDSPWPVYANNGVTEAWLVSRNDASANR